MLNHAHAGTVTAGYPHDYPITPKRELLDQWGQARRDHQLVLPTLRGISINGAATGVRGINFLAGLAPPRRNVHSGVHQEGVLMNSAAGDLTSETASSPATRALRSARSARRPARRASFTSRSPERPPTGISKASASKAIRSASCPTARPQTIPSTGSSSSRRASVAPK